MATRRSQENSSEYAGSEESYSEFGHQTEPDGSSDGEPPAGIPGPEQANDEISG
jgi:hypothetical protein